MLAPRRAAAQRALAAPRIRPSTRARASRARRLAQALPGPRRELPRQAVAFAVLLLAAGFSCIVAGLALGAQGTANATALFILGAMMFTPVRSCPVGSRRALRCRSPKTPRARLPRAWGATQRPAFCRLAY